MSGVKDLDRRQLLGGTAAMLGLVGCSKAERLVGTPGPGLDAGTIEQHPDGGREYLEKPEAEAPDLPGNPFTLGVASGDPLPGSVILWTRLAPAPLNGGGMPDLQVPVVWAVSENEALTKIVAAGVANALPENAHTLHVDAQGLDPNTWYYYQFCVGDYVSPVARTRTAPAEDQSVDEINLAVASCQDWRDGYFTAHAHLAAEAIDLVLFVGDYIYERGPNGDVRDHNTGDATNLAGYRDRYAQYKTDENLQAAHARCPWVVSWDDHEVANDYGMPGSVTEQRRTEAYKAFYEHHPIRLQATSSAEMRIYRSQPFGALAQISVLDTRQYRQDLSCGPGEVGPCAAPDEVSLDLLGPEQESWLKSELSASTAQWNIVASPVVFADLTVGGLNVYEDQWDGFQAQRHRIAAHVNDTGIEGLLVVSGDRHAAALAELTADPANSNSTKIGAEVVCNSISSDGDQNFLEAAAKEAWSNIGHVNYAQAQRRGYALLRLTATSCRVRFRVVNTVSSPTSSVSTDAEWLINRNTWQQAEI